MTRVEPTAAPEEVERRLRMPLVEALETQRAVTTLPVWSVRRTRRLLGLPRGVRPVCAVPLGWPRGRYGPTTRRPVAEVTHLDRYGNRVDVDAPGGGP